ncbi:MAG: hypothetical protein IT242_05370 [Bacteroidia bacterium]|nr:hypothetical protein [Bacteroidia bacterium]
MSRNLITFTFFFLILRSSTGQNLLFQVGESFEDTILSHSINSQTITSDSGNQHFSRTGNGVMYGFGYECEFPASVKGLNTDLVFSEKIRVSDKGGMASIVLNILKGDSTVAWQEFPVGDGQDTSFSWTTYSSKFRIPGSITGPGYRIKLFLWNKRPEIIVDMDDFQLSYYSVSMPDFGIPDAAWISLPPSGSYETVAAGRTFSILQEKTHGGIQIVYPDGTKIMDSLFIYYDGYKLLESDTERVYGRIDAFSSAVHVSGKDLWNFSGSDSILSTELGFYSLSDQTGLGVDIHCTLNDSLELHRLSLGYSFANDVSQFIYDNGRTTGKIPGETAWLGRGGIVAGSGSHYWWVYNRRNASSIQCNPMKRRVMINLDAAFDHPLLHWPYSGDREGWFVDRSTTPAGKGTVFKASEKIFVSDPFMEVPGIIPFPSGFEAALIWNEHADYTEMPTQRAIYFGADSIESVASATGGFIFHHIPVTKSVFYSNPDKVNNSVKDPAIHSYAASITGTREFPDFLRQLNGAGIEICLHTPEHFTSTRSRMNEALAYTQKAFQSTSWIDHGYDNHPESNREDLMCDGLDNSSTWYSLDLWKEYGIKYIWNSYYEDTNLYNRFRFNSTFQVPYQGFGHSLPEPVFWEHPSRSGNLIHWRTTGTLDPPDASLWNYYFDDSRLNDLVHSGSTCIIHCYPARVDATTGFYNRTGIRVNINENFDRVLGKLDAYRNAGKLWLTTIREGISYRCATDSVEILPGKSEEEFIIKNHSHTDFSGLTLMTISRRILVQGRPVSSKIVGDKTLHWFTLDHGEELIIKLSH